MYSDQLTAVTTCKHILVGKLWPKLIPGRMGGGLHCLVLAEETPVIRRDNKKS